MPSIDYTQFATVANRILTQFGIAATLKSEPAGTYNPATSTAAVTPITQDITAVAFPYPEKLIDGTTVRRDDLQVFVAPDGVTVDPKALDVLTYNGLKYVVVSAKNYKPAGTPVLYELQVRK